MPDSSAPRRTGFALPGTRRRRIGAGLAVIAASAAAIGIVLGAGPSSSQGASKPAKASGAATVARRDLVSTDTESGTLGYANPKTVFNRLSGTITSLPAVGKVINPGQTLYDVDSNPVVLFNGTTPAYRDLSAGVSNGLDVYELKQDLKALGFDPDHQITVNQTFDAASTAAIERWQASIGQTQTGTVTLGQIVFLPGAQRITQVETVLGSTGGASAASGSGSTASASAAVVTPGAEFVDLTTHPATPEAAQQPKVTAKSTNDATRTTKSTTTSCPTSLTKPTKGQTTTTAAIAATKHRIAALCREQATANSMTAQQTLAALIALLNAETAQLKRSSGSAASGTASGSGGTGSAGGTSARSSSSGSGGGSSSGAASSGGSSSGGSSAGGGSSSSAGSTSSGSASGGGTAQAILQTTSTQLVVSVQLDATKQSEAVVGQPVTVELPNGHTVDGKITGVSPVAQSASSSSSSSSGSGSGGGGGGSASSPPSSTVPVTITLKGHQSATGLDQAAVSVNFEQQVENNVLSVPVTALLATSGGGYALQESSAPGRMIPVTPGLFAAGFVQVSGTGIYPGLQVTDSQG